MNNFVYLAFQRAVIGFIAIPKSKNGDTCHKVQIFLPIQVVEVHVLSPVKHNLISVVCVKQRLFRLVDITLHFCAHHFLHFETGFNRKSFLCPDPQ